MRQRTAKIERQIQIKSLARIPFPLPSQPAPRGAAEERERMNAAARDRAQAQDGFSGSVRWQRPAGLRVHGLRAQRTVLPRAGAR